MIGKLAGRLPWREIRGDQRKSGEGEGDQGGRGRLGKRGRLPCMEIRGDQGKSGKGEKDQGRTGRLGKREVALEGDQGRSREFRGLGGRSGYEK